MFIYMRNAQISFDEAFLNTIDKIAAESQKTRSAIVREAIGFWLKQKEIREFENKWIQRLKETNDDTADLEDWSETEQWG
jgi:metal-responsive CopG/Arc/MetJ family transcriptional regulator